jgi:hypothetical protein
MISLPKTFTLLIIVFINIYSPFVSSQESSSLRGFVTDAVTGEAIIYANVVVKGSGRGASTDTRGYYYLPNLTAGEKTVEFSYIGYKKNIITALIKEGEIARLDVKLIPSKIELEDISIVGERTVREAETDLGLHNISIQEIEMIPTGIEADVFRALQTVPGVSSTGDITAQYYVRGGGSDQNLVLLNGATVYNPFHALGIFSVIDPEMITMIEFYKGAFTPNYGERLSSILNVITKDGNKNDYKSSASASFVSAKASVEGPIPGGSFIATGRKSYFTKVLKNYLNNKEAPFDFYDLSYKVNYANHELVPEGKFIFHGFISKDEVNNQDPLREDYWVKNNIIGLNWHQVWSSPLYSVMTFSYSGYEAEVVPNLSSAKPRWNKISDITNHWNFTYMYSSYDELHFGLQNTFLTTDLELENIYGRKASLSKNGYQMRGHVNYRFFRFDKVGIDVGVRVNFVSISDRGPFFLEPRFSITYKPVETIALKAAFGRHSQEIISLADERELISIYEPWTIIPEYLAPSEATQGSLGMNIFFTEKLSLDTEAYYKKLTRLVEVNSEKYSRDSYDFIHVDGESYGLETSLNYQELHYYFKMSYSLSWSFKNRKGETFYPRYDSRHSIHILTGADLGLGWKSSFSWSLRSGMPFTPIAGYYDRIVITPDLLTDPFGNLQPAILWGDKNSSRLPYYHRLDFNISKDFSISILDFTIGVNVINVYNRKNLFYFNRNTGERVNMLPFLPTAFIKVEI